MGEHRHSKSRRVGPAAEIRTLVQGAGVGFLVGVLFLGFGLLRAGFYVLRGGHLPPITADELRLASYYVGGFSIAGAAVGGVVSHLRSVAGMYALFACAGMIVVASIMAGEKGGLRSNDAIDWVILMSVGAFFGLVFAYGLRKRG